MAAQALLGSTGYSRLRRRANGKVCVCVYICVCSCVCVCLCNLTLIVFLLLYRMLRLPHFVSTSYPP